jgi:hypothetical protein
MHKDDFDHISKREEGLRETHSRPDEHDRDRRRSGRALLGSKFAIGLAGPSVI